MDNIFYLCLSPPYGRLGNYMFQYAHLKSLFLSLTSNQSLTPESMNKYKMCIPTCSNLHSYFPNILYNDIKLKNYDFIKEQNFNYNPNIKNKIKGNTLISGFWQSEKYFQQYKDIILTDFTFNNIILDFSKKYIDSIRIINHSLVAIQIRRTDYLTTNGFISPNIDNIINSIIYYKNKFTTVIFIFVSDDINWCKNNFSNINNTYFSNNNEVIDLCIMSLCDHQIISASSFGWWGAYLNPNPNKLITCLTRQWFDINKSVLSNSNTCDVLLDNWLSGIPHNDNITLITAYDSVINSKNYKLENICNLKCNLIIYTNNINLLKEYCENKNNIQIIEQKFDTEIIPKYELLKDAITKIKTNWLFWINYDAISSNSIISRNTRFPNINALYEIPNDKILFFKNYDLTFENFFGGHKDVFNYWLEQDEINQKELNHYIDTNNYSWNHENYFIYWFN